MSPVKRSAPRIRSPKRMLTLASTLFLTLAGTSVAQASWTAPGVTATASVTAGSLAVTQAGFDTLAVIYDSSTLSLTKVVTVTNTGTIPAPYTLTLTAPATTLSTGVDLQTWPVATEAACSTTATSTSPAGQHWTSALTFADSGATALAVGASAYFCVRSTITQAQRFALVGVSAVPTVTLTSSIGNWAISSSAMYATQTVANTLTPGAPVASATTDHGTTLAWTKPADTAAITGYQVFRGTQLLTTTTPQTTTFIDVSANVGTKYAYTIKAIDSAGDSSPASPGTSVTTLGVDSSHWYKVTNVGNGKCIDGEGEIAKSGTAMISYGCKATGYANQSWQFSNPSGASTVTGKFAPLLGWDTSTNSGKKGTTAGALAELITLTTTPTNSQTWTIQPVLDSAGATTGTYQFVNGFGMCLDTSGIQTPTPNTELEQAACGAGVPSQTFTISYVVFP